MINLTCSLTNGLIVKIIIFDGPGQERYRSMFERYYKKADSIILVYDISYKASFEECKNYFNNKIKELCKENIKVLLIGNKSDKEEKREITFEEGQNLAIENNYFFMETSCLKNENVFEAFEKIIVYTAVDKKLEDKKK